MFRQVVLDNSYLFYAFWPLHQQHVRHVKILVDAHSLSRREVLPIVQVISRSRCVQALDLSNLEDKEVTCSAIQTLSE